MAALVVRKSCKVEWTLVGIPEKSKFLSFRVDCYHGCWLCVHAHLTKFEFTIKRTNAYIQVGGCGPWRRLGCTIVWRTGMCKRAKLSLWCIHYYCSYVTPCCSCVFDWIKSCTAYCAKNQTLPLRKNSKMTRVQRNSQNEAPQKFKQYMVIKWLYFCVCTMWICRMLQSSTAKLCFNWNPIGWLLFRLSELGLQWTSSFSSHHIWIQNKLDKAIFFLQINISVPLVHKRWESWQNCSIQNQKIIQLYTCTCTYSILVVTNGYLSKRLAQTTAITYICLPNYGTQWRFDSKVWDLFHCKQMEWGDIEYEWVETASVYAQIEEALALTPQLKDS